MIFIGDIAHSFTHSLAWTQGKWPWTAQPVVANLEGALVHDGHRYLQSRMLFNHVSIVDSLIATNVQAINLANNHSQKMVEGFQMLTEDEIAKIRSFVLEWNILIAIYIFGSVATGRNRQGSDIDLALMVRGTLSGIERVEMETAFSNLLHRDVDLVVFSQATPLLQHQILKYGRLIHEVDTRERVRQEVLARSHYLDGAFLYKKLGKGKKHGG